MSQNSFPQGIHEDLLKRCEKQTILEGRNNSYVSERCVFEFASITFQLCDGDLENGIKLSLFKLLMRRFKLDKANKSINDLG